ncbi:MAG: GGDEF domain-containing protein [Gammaproteobacteria bacterium]|nr:GGDEF domain-containing protein [Gammaproteobacteria bacterium]
MKSSINESSYYGPIRISSTSNIRGTQFNFEILLLVLTILYMVIPAQEAQQVVDLTTGCLVYFSYSVVFHQLSLQKLESEDRFAAQTVAMIAFITWVVWSTGKFESPLVILYLLPVVVSGFALGTRYMTLMVGAISMLFLMMSYWVNMNEQLAVGILNTVVIQLTPLWLTAYVLKGMRKSLRQAIAEIQHVSDRDPLTGLRTHDSFARSAEIESLRCIRYKHPFSMLMIDIDNMADINDKLGHDIGNLAIKYCAKHIIHVFRQTDTIARIGGNRFAVILPETDSTKAMVTAERVRLNTARNALKLHGMTLRIHVSIGVASYPENGNTFEVIQQGAEMALMNSKLNGRNRSTRADGIRRVA